MMEDESMRTYICRISKIFAKIKAHGGNKDLDEIIWKILESLRQPFKKTPLMIEKVIPCTKKFSKETLLGRLEATKVNLKKNGDLPKIETTFNTLSMRPSLSRSVSTSGNYVGSNKEKYEEDVKIEEGIALLVKRELEGEKIFKSWTCKEYGHFASKCP